MARVTRPEDGFVVLHDRPCSSFDDCIRVERLLVEAGRRSPRLVVDCSEVVIVSATFLSTLLKAYHRLGARPGDIVLCSLQPVVRQVVELTRLDQLFPLCEDRTEAIRHDWPIAEPSIVEAK